MADWTDLLGGLISGYRTYTNNEAADEQNEQAQDDLEKAYNTINGVTSPDLTALLKDLQRAEYYGEITPEDYARAVEQGTLSINDYERGVSQGDLTAEAYDRAVSQGDLTPEMINTILQGKSELSDVSADPTAVADQMDALAKLKAISDQGGLTAIDRARLNDIASAETTTARGLRDAATADAAAKGMSGGGLEAVRRAIADQGAISNMSKRDLGVAADAEARALQAIAQQGTLAGNIRSQDYGEKSTAARAQDAINAFNTQIQNQAEQANVSARNKAAADNLAQKYNLQTQNLSQGNLENAAKEKAAQQNLANAYALQALNMQQGNLQNQAQEKVDATNLANKYNVQTQNLNQGNLENAAKVAAAQQALAQKYAVQTQNIGQSNLEQANQLQAAQNMFNNNLNKAKSSSQIASNQAAMLRGMAQESQKRSDAFGSAVGTSLANYFGGVGGATAGSNLVNGLFGSGSGSNSGSSSTGGLLGGIGNLFGGSSSGNTWQTPGINGNADYNLGDWSYDTGSNGDWSYDIGSGNDYSDYGSSDSGGLWDTISDGASSVWDTVTDWFSDENLKKNVNRLSEKEIKAILDGLEPYSFEMKDEKMGPGNHVGILAQDLIGTPGEVILKQKPEGLAVDGKKAQELALASLAGLNKRVSKLEKK